MGVGKGVGKEVGKGAGKGDGKCLMMGSNEGSNARITAVSDGICAVRQRGLGVGWGGQ